jgi:hypothetical protein
LVVLITPDLSPLIIIPISKYLAATVTAESFGAYPSKGYYCDHWKPGLTRRNIESSSRGLRKTVLTGRLSHVEHLYSLQVMHITMQSHDSLEDVIEISYVNSRIHIHRQNSFRGTKTGGLAYIPFQLTSENHRYSGIFSDFAAPSLRASSTSSGRINK